MKKLLILIITLSMIALYTATAEGAVVGLGARAIGMGGAYTAVADGEYAAYWNPAGITNTKHMEAPIGFGFQGDINKLMKVIDKLSQSIPEMPAREDLNQSYFGEGYLGLSTKYFAFSGYTDSQLRTAINNSQDISATLRSINGGVVTIASRMSDELAVGINVKAVFAGNGAILLPHMPTQEEFGGDPLAYLNALNNYTGSVSYNSGVGTACDIGVLYQISPKLNVGFTARNVFGQINTKEGKTNLYGIDPLTKQLVIKGQEPYNAPVNLPKANVLGIAYQPFESTLLAADAEILDDQTRFHFGFEQTALWNLIAVRAGCFTNKGEELGTTAGLGFKLWIFNSNLAYVGFKGQEYILSGSIKF